MSRHLSRRWRKSIVSAAAVATSAALVPSFARADLTLNLRLPSGGTTALIGGDQTNTDIPIQVWATVTGTQTQTPMPAGGTFASDPQAGTGVFDGIQYAYYNILNSNSAGNYIAGGVDTAAGKTPTLNPFLKFNSNGSQAGLVQNIAGGVSVGSTTKITDVPKPRASSAIFDNQSYYNQSAGYFQELGNDGINISANGSTASFLLETINFKPTAYTALTKTTFSLQAPAATFTATAADKDLDPANWFQNITSQNLGTGNTPPSTTYTGSDSGNLNSAKSTISIGTSVTIQDTLNGDANLDGSVGPADFLILRKNYNVVSTGGKWAQGDFNHDGAVGPADFLLLRSNYNQTIASAQTVAQTAAKGATLAATPHVSSAKSASLVVGPLTVGTASPNVVTASPQTPPSGEVQLVVYTGNGDVQLLFNNASLALYDITSASGELVPANLKPISGQSGYSQYGFFSFPSSSSAISEATFGSGPTLVNGTIDLGNIFSLNVAAASRDLVFQEADNNGNLYTIDVDYINASSAPEPTSLLLFGVTSVGLLGRRRRTVGLRLSRY